MSEEDPLAPVVGLLDRHGVRYVLVGLRAAALHGFDVPTRDTDVLPDPDPDNLRRLNDALREVHAEVGSDIRVPDDPTWLTRRAIDAGAHESVAVPTLTDVGEIDVVLRASGVPGFDDWSEGAEERDVGGVTVLVGSLEDIVASKEAAGRDKDALHVPVLRALLAARHRERPVDPTDDAVEAVGLDRPAQGLPAVVWDWAADAVDGYRDEFAVPVGDGLGSVPDDPDRADRYHGVVDRLGQTRDALAFLDRALTDHPSAQFGSSDDPAEPTGVGYPDL